MKAYLLHLDGSRSEVEMYSGATVSALLNKVLKEEDLGSFMGIDLLFGDTSLSSYPGSTGLTDCGLTDGVELTVVVKKSPIETRLAEDQRSIYVEDASTGDCKWTLVGHSGSVRTGVLSFDESLYLSASVDGSAKIWDLSSGECKHTLSEHTGPLYSAEFSLDEALIVTASADNTAKVWDASTGECKHTLSGHSGEVQSAVFAADACSVLTASCDGTAKMWDTLTGDCKRTFSGHTCSVDWVGFSEDGSSVRTSGTEKTSSGIRTTYKTWDPLTGECTHTSVVDDDED
eukprot:TRINITY_DN76689_c0_g1_i1.p1 TRINITY_DN76689_c0_g1~~TRINITY_DN76689_c0_g1_i1.p1  ORF type:complete len:317 (+),score=56.15 TRINITY_DN76689_c0_g1_i1:89-952(+)